MRTAVARLLAVVLPFLLVGLALPAHASPGVEPLPTGTDVDYQLGGAAAVPDHVGIIARDRTAAPVAGRYNICYVNGFQTQDDEKGFWKAHMGLVLHRHGRPVVDEHWGEFLLDVRTPATRAALARIVGRWVEGCATSGFQAVEFDNLDSFTRSHGLMKRRQAFAFARLLVAEAHRAGLAAGQKNLADWDGTSVGYDFAVSEECAHYDECGSYLRHYGDQVVMIEYDDRDFAKACRSSYAARVAVVRRDRDLRPGFRPRFC